MSLAPVLPERGSSPMSLRIAAVLLACGPLGVSAASLDLGDPSVMSQQGQRLKIALPYASAPGERVSPTRFEVVSIEAPPGYPAPAAGDVTISAPQRRNLVFLQSRERVEAPELTVTVRIADQPDSTRTWRLGMHAALATPAPSPSAETAPTAAAPRRRTTPPRRTVRPQIGAEASVAR